MPPPNSTFAIRTSQRSNPKLQKSYFYPAPKKQIAVMEKEFDNFQIEEYKNISNAHFETNKQIGIFFRYFLLIASAPAFIIVALGKGISENIEVLFNGKNNETSILFIGFFLIFIAIIGILASIYLISLHLDAILYARTVNGTRRYFYKIGKHNNEELYRVLPKQTNIPKYFDFHTFGVLFYAIAFINSAYLALGTRIIASIGDSFFKNYLYFKPFINNYNIYWTFGSFIIVFILHIIFYNLLSKYRLFGYLKCRIIGIDIDGVLNKHRETFSKIHSDNLHKQYGENIPENKKIIPEEINKIPISSIERKNISRDDEFDIFNNPKYWEEQEIIEPNISKIITELKNSFGFKIYIHSYRPWPQYLYGKTIKSKNNLWNNISLSKITKLWLKDKKIPYDKLYIEKNSIDKPKRNLSILKFFFGISIIKNRFYYTLKTPYRYFIEDEIDNAIKLSNNCEYILLFDQPYNQTNDTKLPENIVRVKSWDEIRNTIKKLG